MTLSTDELLRPFVRGIRGREDFRLGVELEFFPVRRADLRMVSYDGDGGIGTILEEMASRHGWTPVRERENIVGLCREGDTVTLEPGGVIEYSSKPVTTMAEIESRSRRFLDEALAVVRPLGAALLPIGFHPHESPDSVELVPKSRYGFMYDYMPRVGSTGRFMMKVTSAVQVAIDYETEADALRKLRLAARLTPVFVALSANSLVRDGAVSDRASNRAHVWLDTDRSRCGFQPFLDDETAGFADYADWALDTPMYFVVREGKQVSMSGRTFREFLAAGAPDEGGRKLEPTPGDWELHLNTLFPWVRLRHFIEIRSFDMNPCPVTLAFAALVKGIFYSEPAIAAAESLCSTVDTGLRDELLDAAIARGLDGEARGHSLRGMSRRLLAMARQGLDAPEPAGSGCLDPLDARVATWSFEKATSDFDNLDEALRSLLIS